MRQSYAAGVCEILVHAVVYFCMKCDICWHESANYEHYFLASLNSHCIATSTACSYSTKMFK